jgi:septum formation protein
MPSLVLASGSPRRRQFLTDLGFSFQVLPSNADETQQVYEPAAAYVKRLAQAKAAAVAQQTPDAVVLAADTIVVRDGEVLGKPIDEADFRRMMRLLSDRTHDVITAVAVRQPGGGHAEVAVDTRVTFRPLSDEEISWYWSTGEPHDKAGGYAIQGRAGAFITRIEGSHSNVIGLPLVETLALLQRAGIQPPWSTR